MEFAVALCQVGQAKHVMHLNVYLVLTFNSELVTCEFSTGLVNECGYFDLDTTADTSDTQNHIRERVESLKLSGSFLSIDARLEFVKGYWQGFSAAVEARVTSIKGAHVLMSCEIDDSSIGIWHLDLVDLIASEQVRIL